MPATERRGRIHTSNVTVSLLGDERRVDADLRDADLRHRWFSGTGPGGQRRNKVQCCLELIHVPTGISRMAHSASREDNARTARAALEQALMQNARDVSHRDRNASRSSQIGSGMRADKRRTWRFQDDQVVDDVTGMRASCDKVMKGRFDLLWPVA